MAAAPVHPFNVMQTALQSMVCGLEQAPSCGEGHGFSKENLRAICEPFFEQMLTAVEQAMEQALERRLEQALKPTRSHVFSLAFTPAASDATVTAEVSLGSELRALRETFNSHSLPSSDEESGITEVVDTRPSNVIHASDSDLTESHHKSSEVKVGDAGGSAASTPNCMKSQRSPRSGLSLAVPSANGSGSSSLPIRKKSVKGYKLQPSPASHPGLAATLSSWMDSFYQSSPERDMDRESSRDSESGWN